MRIVLGLLPAAAAALFLSTAAFADVKAVYRADGKESSSLAVKAHLVLWTFTDPRGRQAMVFDNKRKALTVIDHSRKEIVEMDEASIKAMQQQMETMMAQMRAQLKNLPPEQRKMIEQRMGVGPSKNKVVAKKGKTDKISGYRCRYYDMMVNGKQEQRVCVATLADAGVSEKDYKTLEGMYGFMRKMAKSQGTSAAPLTENVKGIPIRMKEFRTRRIQTVTSISTGGLPDSLFKVPSYKRVDPFAPPPRR